MIAPIYTPAMPRKRQREPRGPFGIRIRDVLKERGLNQVDLGRMIGYSQSGVSQAILGDSQPTMEFVELVAKALGLDREELVMLAFGPKVDDRREVAVEAVRMAMSGEPRWLERVLLDVLAEYYQEPPFVSGYDPDQTALPPDAVHTTAIRRVQIFESRLRKRRTATGTPLPPPLLFVTGE